MQPELDLPKLTLAERLKEQIRPKFGDFATRVRSGVREHGRVLIHIGHP